MLNLPQYIRSYPLPSQLGIYLSMILQHVEYIVESTKIEL